MMQPTIVGPLRRRDASAHYLRRLGAHARCLPSVGLQAMKRGEQLASDWATNVSATFTEDRDLKYAPELIHVFQL
jgi:hypothetical protein